MLIEMVPLVILLALSIVGKNQPVAVATSLLLIIKLLGLNSWFLPLESKGMTIGITILTLAILAPLASGRISINTIVDTFRSPIALIALAAGVFVAWAAGRGLLFINSSPEIVTSLVLGTVVGVCFLQGVPIGPLIAGGLVSLAITFANFFR